MTRKVKLLDADDCAVIRRYQATGWDTDTEGPALTHDYIQLGPCDTGRKTCRVCGARIKKGEAVVEFGVDEVNSTSKDTASYWFVHRDPCDADLKVSPAKEAKIKRLFREGLDEATENPEKYWS